MGGKKKLYEKNFSWGCRGEEGLYREADRVERYLRDISSSSCINTSLGCSVPQRFKDEYGDDIKANYTQGMTIAFYVKYAGISNESAGCVCVTISHDWLFTTESERLHMAQMTVAGVDSEGVDFMFRRLMDYIDIDRLSIETGINKNMLRRPRLLAAKRVTR